MERDPAFDETTREVLEGLLVTVCSVFSPLTQSQLDCHLPCQHQPSTCASVAEEKSERACFDDRAASVSEVIIVDDVMSQKKNTFEDNAEVFVCNHTDEEMARNSGYFSSERTHEKNPFDECNDMINKLLDTFDTDVNNEECGRSMPEESKYKAVSRSPEHCRTDASIEKSLSVLSNCQSIACGSSEHCSKTKEINDQRYLCESFPGASTSTPTVADGNDSALLGKLDSEIDLMVDQIICDNVQLLSSTPHCKSRLKNKPGLRFESLAPPGIDRSDPQTPECSENFAELRLNANESILRLDSRSPDRDSASTVPPGWLDTLTKRRQRSDLYSSPRVRTRSDDFAYCGPNREKNGCKEASSFSPRSTCLKLRRPEQASEIPTELLYSGVAITPGSCDKTGNPLLIVLADDIVWQKSNAGAISLARLLLYLTFRLVKATLVLDCRNSTVPILKSILEAFSIFRGNSRTPIHHTLLLCSDNNFELSTVQSTLQSLFKCECSILRSVDELPSFVDRTSLQKSHGGDLRFSQAEWAQNRLVVDAFVSFCDNVRHNFERETASMTSHSLPQTAKETQALLQLHHRDMARLLDDRQLSNMRDRSQRILQQLASDGGADAKSCARSVQNSFSAANDVITCFVKIADDQLVALEQHLLVKQFEQSCDYIHQWYTSNSEILKSLFAEIPDSFDELKRQRAEFDAFYINAMTDYAKCDCLLSEVGQLNELGYLREAELEQRAKITEAEVKELVYKMEKKKEEVEIATHMYKFIDQAYSWALEGMKFVAMLNMSECQSFDSCQKMIDEFDEYMQRHPPIPEMEFAKIQSLCRRYNDIKCQHQCDYALQKCKETSELFEKRRQLIAKLKSQFKSSSKKRFPSFRLLKGRDKSDSNSQDSKSSTSSRSSTSRASTSIGDESVDDEFSLNSPESPTCKKLNERLSLSLPPGNMTPMSEIEFLTKSNARPARKVLKKSVSLPAHQMTSYLTNQHVHSSSGDALAIGSPVPVGKEMDENSRKVKIALIIAELIATEKEYVRSLNYVIENYFPEMSKLEIPQALRCKRNVIFGNIEKIADFHSCKFLNDLENCDGNPLKLAKTFQLHKDNFGLYALYSKNKPQSDQLLQEHGNDFFKTKQMELGDKMDLASYLLKPVQRMGKYALLLHAMSKHCSPVEERCLKEAEELVKFQLRHGNDLLTMDAIRDCDVNLKEQGNLLRQEQFIIYSGRRKIVRRVFLFEDLILFSKPLHVHSGHDIYQYKCSYKTAEIGMTENIGETGFKFEIWFRRRRPQSTQDTYILQSSNRAIKRAWVEEIRGILWEQALRNKTHRKDEMSSMGVGSKPHLDLLLSSANRITDRSVIAMTPSDRHLLSDRITRSRTRVSVAVPTYECVTQQSKRPHSTISTSSSTSSVGSGNNQSSSLFSSLNLASWPSKCDIKSHSGLGPPMAYCDFHAIAEDLNEDCESSSDSSVTTSHDVSAEAVYKSPVSRQYVTTV